MPAGHVTAGGPKPPQLPSAVTPDSFAFSGVGGGRGRVGAQIALNISPPGLACLILLIKAVSSLDSG